MADRDLAEIRREAQQQRRPAAEIEPYAITANGHRVVLRRPSEITADESDNARSGLAGQIRLLCYSRQDYVRLWGVIKHWAGDEIVALINDVTDHYTEQERGKGSSSTSSTDTPTR